MKTLSKIESQGFTVNLMGDRLEIKPSAKLTELQRGFLRHHKAQIIAEIKDRIAITRWLDFIQAGEQDRLEVFEQCSNSDKALKYFLWRSLEAK